MASEGDVRDAINNFDRFLQLHQQQLISSGIPSHFWDALFNKLRNGILDAGDYFQIMRVEKDIDDLENGDDAISDPLWKVIVVDEEGIDVRNPHHIFIIDHAWTFRLDKARAHLETIPNLVERIASLMDIEMADRDKQSLIDNVLVEMWRYIQTYSVRGLRDDVETTLPIWYVMDEFGSKIQHSDEPSFRAVPFYYAFAELSYTLLFPIQNLKTGDEVSRNFIEGPYVNQQTIRALKIPWFYSCMTDIDCNVSEPGEDYFLSYRLQETLPSPTLKPSPWPKTDKIKVFSEYQAINSYLTHPAFEIVADEGEADILWYMQHFKDFRALSENSPDKVVNQFPNENIVTIKDLLSNVCRRVAVKRSGAVVNSETLETYPGWFPMTYNLTTELPQMVSYFQRRENRGLDNHWICKPWNLARGLDTVITDNLNCIVRLPATGPKIACKYVEDPLLFHRAEINGGPVKFDMRYILLLRSVKPLRVYVYQRFWLRFANKPFSLGHLDDYEKHFTVMNYRDSNLKQMFCHDFIQEFERQYPDFRFDQIEEEIFGMFKDVFEATTSLPPPRGMAHSPQSRAMYGADVMLAWDSGHQEIHPVLLEINWCPDCKRACHYYPEFFDDVFSVLFLDDDQGKHARLL